MTGGPLGQGGCVIWSRRIGRLNASVSEPIVAMSRTFGTILFTTLHTLFGNPLNLPQWPLQREGFSTQTQKTSPPRSPHPQNRNLCGTVPKQAKGDCPQRIQKRSRMRASENSDLNDFDDHHTSADCIRSSNAHQIRTRCQTTRPIPKGTVPNGFRNAVECGRLKIQISTTLTINTHLPIASDPPTLIKYGHAAKPLAQHQWALRQMGRSRRIEGRTWLWGCAGP
jgi:hypothetical protein